MSGHPDMPGHARTWLHVRVQSDAATLGDLSSNANRIEGKLFMLHLPDPFVTDEDNVRCLEVRPYPKEGLSPAIPILRG